jgi:hypothetical protein
MRRGQSSDGVHRLSSEQRCFAAPESEIRRAELSGHQPNALDERTRDQGFLGSSHPTIPNIILSPEEIDSVAAYILSLPKK